MEYESAYRQQRGWGRVLFQRLGLLMGALLLAVNVGACAKPIEPTLLIEEPTTAPNLLTSPLAEVSPPEAVQTLKQVIDTYTPQVRLLSPRPEEVIEEDTVTVRLQVRGLPLFKDDRWQLGPHINLILDDEPVREIFDPHEPLVFNHLSPGTHTLRLFAVRPWNESFKNEGAYVESVFHIYAPTPQKMPQLELPLLTYNQPQGSYGAEPILLDFYLSHTPLHQIAQADPNDNTPDWRIRCTINGNSFVFDRWQPIYLTGFKPGRNWLQLELIDDQGTPIDNRFNTVVRAIDYTPGGNDGLSQLLRGDLPLDQVIGLIDATYVPPMEPSPETEAEAEDAMPEKPTALGEEDGLDGVETAVVTDEEEASPPASATESTVTEMDVDSELAGNETTEESAVEQADVATDAAEVTEATNPASEVTHAEGIETEETEVTETAGPEPTDVAGDKEPEAEVTTDAEPIGETEVSEAASTAPTEAMETDEAKTDVSATIDPTATAEGESADSAPSTDLVSPSPELPTT